MPWFILAGAGEGCTRVLGATGNLLFQRLHSVPASLTAFLPSESLRNSRASHACFVFGWSRGMPSSLRSDPSHQGRQGEHGLQQAAREAAQGDSGRQGGGLRWVPREVGLRGAVQGHRAPRALVVLCLGSCFFGAVSGCGGCVASRLGRPDVREIKGVSPTSAAAVGGWVDWMYE